MFVYIFYLRLSLSSLPPARLVVNECTYSMIKEKKLMVVPGTWHLVRGGAAWNLAPGTWYQVPYGWSTRMVDGIYRYQVPGTWYGTIGHKFPGSSTWYRY